MNNSVFKGALTVKIATFEIHVDVLGLTTRAQRPVIIHESNRLPAVVAGSSFFHDVKAHEISVSPGYGRVDWLLAPEDLDVVLRKLCNVAIWYLSRRFNPCLKAQNQKVNEETLFRNLLLSF